MNEVPLQHNSFSPNICSVAYASALQIVLSNIWITSGKGTEWVFRVDAHFRIFSQRFEDSWDDFYDCNRYY